jgi:hypothetical protein
MPILDVQNLAKAGLAVDVPDLLLPSGAWTDSRNIRYRDGAAEKCKGYEQAMGNLSLTARWAAPITDGSSYFWVYASNSVLYATDGNTHANVSHASLSYVATDDLGWTGGAFHGRIIANDGITVPQVWSPGLGNRFASLSHWPAISAQVVRPFKDFIFALRITDGGSFLPRTIRWSDKAPNNAMPTSWDYQDPTNQAGITELAQTGDLLVDCAPLRDSLIIYKESHTWVADYIGMPDVFSFRQIFTQAGLLAEDCIAQLGTAHVVLTDNDLVWHDGNSMRSIADKRMRRWLFSRISPTHYKRTFLMTDYRNREVYICFPESGREWANMALAWNWAEDTFHIYDLGREITYGTHGTIPTGSVSTTFDSETGPFDLDSGTFDESTYSQFLTRLLLLDARGKRAYQNDTGETYAGVPMGAWAQRTGTSISHPTSGMNRIYRIYPNVTGTHGDVLHFHIGTRETSSATTNWTGPYYYTIGVDHKIDMRPVPGRIVDIHVEYHTSLSFRFFGYRVEFEPDGRR